MKKKTVKIFKDSTIHNIWDRDNEKWCITIVDVIAVLTESIDTAAY